MKTYVAYTLPDKHRPAGAIKLVEVADRDIVKLDIPKTAYEFYFLDTPETVEALADPLGHEENMSPMYIVAKEIWSRERLKEHFAASADFQRRAQDQTVVGRLKAGDMFRAVWEVKADSTPFHAVARTGEILQIRDGMIVIDENKNLLHPKPPTAPRIRQIKPPVRNYKL